MGAELKKSNLIFGIIIVISILYFDLYGIVTLIGGYAFISLIEDKKKKIQEGLEENNMSIDKKDIVLFWLSIFGAYLVMFLYYCTDWDTSVVISNFQLLPSFLFMYYFLLPIIYWVKKHKEKIKKKDIMIGIPVLCLATFKSLYSILSSNIPVNTYGSATNIAFSLFQVVVVAAIMEELFFRSYVYDFAESIYGSKAAMVISSLLFTFIHFNLIEKCLSLNYSTYINLFAVLFLGILMAKLYEITRIILVCILFHAITDGALLYISLLIRL